MLGYTGAQPRPRITRPAREFQLPSRGSSIHPMPRIIPAVPRRIMFRSPSFSDTRPDRNRPAVMPMKNNEPKAAAISFEMPLASTR